MFAFKVTILTIIVASVAGSAIDVEETSPAISSTTVRTTTHSTGRKISLVSSNAPDIQYALDAIQCLTTAYTLHPGSIDTVITTYARLYQLQHRGNWNAHAGCTSLYIPKAQRIRIDLKVTEGSNVTIVNLYN